MKKIVILPLSAITEKDGPSELLARKGLSKALTWWSDAVLSNHAKSLLMEMEMLIEKGVTFYFIGHTHQNVINSLEKQYGKSLPGISHWSFQQNKTGWALYKDLLNRIKRENKQADIALFFNFIPYPGRTFNPFSFFNPLNVFRRWVYDCEREEIESVGKWLNVNQDKYSLEMVFFSPLEKSSIGSKLFELGWMKAKQVSQKSLTFLPYFKRKSCCAEVCEHQDEHKVNKAASLSA